MLFAPAQLLLLSLLSPSRISAQTSPRADFAPADPWVVADPFTPFHDDFHRTLALESIAPLAEQFVKWGVNTVWVMGDRGQWDTLSRGERLQLTEEWVTQGHKNGLRVLIHCGTGVMQDARDIAEHAEKVGADGIGAIGPAIELAGNTERVFEFVGRIASFAPKTPFYYYHTASWNDVALNRVRMNDFFRLNENKAIPTLAGVIFESALSEWDEMYTRWNAEYKLIWGPGNSLAWFEQNQLGAGAVVQTYGAPSFHRMYDHWLQGNAAEARKEVEFFEGMRRASGGVFMERHLYTEMCPGCNMGPARWPQPHINREDIEAQIVEARATGMFDQSWAPTTAPPELQVVV